MPAMSAPAASVSQLPLLSSGWPSQPARWRRYLAPVSTAAALHAAVWGVAVWQAQSAWTPPPPAPAMQASILPPSPLPMAAPEPAKPPAPKPRPTPVKRQPRPTPPPMVSQRASPAPVAVAAPAPQPVSQADSAPPSPPAEKADKAAAPAAPTSAPRFDAAYLNNPEPPYPAVSRRLGEEGRVLLNVQVEPDGSPRQVRVARSCGYPRLDEAARGAVEKWRFVPARQGERPVAASVNVPIHFRLDG